MAVGSIIWLDGVAQAILSSGTTPTVSWVDGLPVVVHEYVASGDGSVVPRIMQAMNQFQGGMQ
jgi:hypothetical protein